MNVYPDLLEWASACTSAETGDCEIAQIHRVVGGAPHATFLEATLTDPVGVVLPGIVWFEYWPSDGLWHECAQPDTQGLGN